MNSFLLLMYTEDGTIILIQYVFLSVILDITQQTKNSMLVVPPLVSLLLDSMLVDILITIVI